MSIYRSIRFNFRPVFKKRVLTCFQFASNIFSPFFSRAEIAKSSFSNLNNLFVRRIILVDFCRTGLEWNFNLEQIIPPLNYSKIRSNIFLSHVHTNIPLVKFIFNLWERFYRLWNKDNYIKFNSMLFSFDQDSIKSYRIGLLNKLIATLFSLFFFLSFFANKLSRLFSTISSNNVIDQRVT